MLMRWTDLEPGDVLEYTNEYREFVTPELGGYWATGKLFTIKTIQYEGNIVLIKFKELEGDDAQDIFPLSIIDGADEEFRCLYNGPAFKIVKLVGE